MRAELKPARSSLSSPSGLAVLRCALLSLFFPFFLPVNSSFEIAAQIKRRDL